MPKVYKECINRHPKGGFRVLSIVPAMLALCITLVGCGQQSPDRPVTGIRVNEPLEAPAYDSQQESVFALSQVDRSLVKVDVSPGGVIQGTNTSSTVSEQFEGVGENFAPDLGESGVLYLPQPELDQITTVEGDDLLSVRSFEAGPSPSRLALAGPVTEDSGVGDTILALSRDGSTVTGVNLDSYRRDFQQNIDVGEGTLLRPSGVGQGFWAAGSEGVIFYDGSVLAGPPDNLELDASALAADPGEQTRAYVGESASGKLQALEAAPTGGLEVVQETDLDSDVEQLAISDGVLYAATNEGVIGLDPESLDVVYTAEFGERMLDDISGRPVPSGMAFSGENVYLTLEGEPYVVEVDKP